MGNLWSWLRLQFHILTAFTNILERIDGVAERVETLEDAQFRGQTVHTFEAPEGMSTEVAWKNYKEETLPLDYVGVKVHVLADHNGNLLRVF